MKSASWVIVERATGKAVMETFRADLVARLRTDRFKAVPALEYLVTLNRHGGVYPCDNTSLEAAKTQ